VVGNANAATRWRGSARGRCRHQRAHPHPLRQPLIHPRSRSAAGAPPRRPVWRRAASSPPAGTASATAQTPPPARSSPTAAPSRITNNRAAPGIVGARSPLWMKVGTGGCFRGVLSRLRRGFAGDLAPTRRRSRRPPMRSLPPRPVGRPERNGSSAAPSHRRAGRTRPASTEGE